MKEEFKDEQELSRRLDAYQVEVPAKKLARKQSPFNRFLRYLASPAKDPLENLAESMGGYLFLKIFPLACGLFLALLQGLWLM